MEEIIVRREFIEKMEKKGIGLLRYLYIDMDGVIRGTSAARDSWDGDLINGVSYSVAMPFFSFLDQLVPGTSYGSVGEVKAVPDLNSFRPVPYNQKTGLMLCDFLDASSREPSVQCSRSYLKKAVLQAGCEVTMAFENEFYLLKQDQQGRYQPSDRSLCFGADGMNQRHEVIWEIIQCLEAQGIPVQKYVPEYGPGQHEIAVKYADALRAADNQVVYRQTVGDIAHNHGLKATFMPKPFADLPGNGCHIHVSLWEEGRNLFAPEGGQKGISDILKHFMAGILKHVDALVAFTAPTVNSYKRLKPGCWSSAYACYGTENKEALIRIIDADGPKVHIEFKACDPTCNPYLAGAALLFAGLEGMQQKLDPGDELLVDPNGLTTEELQEKGINRLPTTLEEAVGNLENDYLFGQVFGSAFIDEYIRLKRFVWNEYMSQVTVWETDNFLRAY